MCKCLISHRVGISYHWKINMYALLLNVDLVLGYTLFCQTIRWGTFDLYVCRFWLAVQQLKRMPQQDVGQRAQDIWTEFLAEGAPSSINLDSHSYERTSQNLKDPGRYSYEDAQVGKYKTREEREIVAEYPASQVRNIHLKACNVVQ